MYPKKVSDMCRQWIEGSCESKKKYTWKECPVNKWDFNKGKKVDDKGELILCTLCDFEEAMEFNDDDVIDEGFYGVERSCVEHDKLASDVTFYTPAYFSSLVIYKLVNDNTD